MTLHQCIQQFFDPQLERYPFAEVSQIKEKEKRLTLHLNYRLDSEHARWQNLLNAHLHQHGFANYRIEFNSSVAIHRVQTGLRPLKNVKNIIAIASGKGGVGKSTVATNLACALQQQGANVGLLDADIYGPSQARMLGGAQYPQSLDGKTMQPIVRHGLQTLSMADLVDENTAMIWRGPMVTQTLLQLLRECHWQELDYLIFDLPPGTGDIQLTLSQQIPVSGAILVSTPQDIALIDARKAKTLFDKVAINVLGIIENMSSYRCSHCGHEEAIFGTQGAQALAQEYNLALLGTLALDKRIREQADLGTPIVLSHPDSDIATHYRHIAARLTLDLAKQQQNPKAIFPKIVIEH